jgi:hypothetical protein
VFSSSVHKTCTKNTCKNPKLIIDSTQGNSNSERHETKSHNNEPYAPACGDGENFAMIACVSPGSASLSTTIGVLDVISTAITSRFLWTVGGDACGASTGEAGVGCVPSRKGPLKKNRAQYHQYTTPTIATTPTTTTA